MSLLDIANQLKKKDLIHVRQRKWPPIPAGTYQLF